MLDNRIYTFLKLCETMNYRKTAEILNMTQPAVTQHIHYLESIYKIKFFEYKNKTLYKTDEGRKLEEYARSIVYNEKIFQKEIVNQKKQKIYIGATKTIGEYDIDNIVEYFVKDTHIEFKLIIDNTKNLLKYLDEFKLDFLIVEGYFDKNKYDCRLFKNEEMVGICSKNHPFADREIDIRDIFSENIILREEGSGTRKVFEYFLKEQNYTYKSFTKNTIISSLSLTERLIEKNLGISFMFNSIPNINNKISVFKLREKPILHEFNFVFLKGSKAVDIVEKIATAIKL